MRSDCPKEMSAGSTSYAARARIPVLVGRLGRTGLGLLLVGDLFRRDRQDAARSWGAWSDDLWRTPLRNDPTHLGRAWAIAASDPSMPQFVCIDDVDRASLSDWFHTLPRPLPYASAVKPLRRRELCLGQVAGRLRRSGDRSHGTGRRCHRCAGRCDRSASQCKAEASSIGQLRVDPARPDERDALLASLMESSLQGGDLGSRLLRVYAAARTWFNPTEAVAFVRALGAGHLCRESGEGASGQSRTDFKTRGAVRL